MKWKERRYSGEGSKTAKCERKQKNKKQGEKVA